VLVETVRGDKKKEAYSYFVLVRRKDKTDESRRCIVGDWRWEKKESEGKKGRRERSADLPRGVTPLATILFEYE
jgi:hypothetical protein